MGPSGDATEGVHPLREGLVQIREPIMTHPARYASSGMTPHASNEYACHCVRPGIRLGAPRSNPYME